MSKSTSENFKSKTGKRELGLVFAGVLCYVILQGEVEMVKAIVWPVMAYIAAASGLHIYGQLQQPGPKAPNGGRP